MCGIIGIIGRTDAADAALDALRRLEYRGYDSAGIATIDQGRIARARAQGKLVNLAQELAKNPLRGAVAIGHTRWATHGAPNEANAHPHATEEVAVVHNGIIENFRTLRAELEKIGHHFTSQTDTEVVPVLISHYLREGAAPKDAVHRTIKRLEGAFALCIIFRDHPDLLIAARRGSPLAIGYGNGSMYVGSDAVALAPLTQKISYLEEGDWAILSKDTVNIYDSEGKKAEREVKITALTGAAVEKGNYRHFMQKEIHEQPLVIGQTLGVFTHLAQEDINLPALSFDLKSVPRITLVACGTSYYATMVAQYWLERYARLPCQVEIASEFRYRDPVLPQGGLALFVSQSGETADTLAALRLAKSLKQHTLAVVNAQESSMAQEAGNVLYTYAGPEIGVASTKAFTTQLVTLACFALAAGSARGVLPAAEKKHLVHTLEELPAKISDILALEPSIAGIAATLAHASDILYMGRGTSYPIALEGALKLKEISYIHAEAYAAGELKHGPIALIDEGVPVVVIAPHDRWFEKTLSNLQEVIARGGKVVLITDAKGAEGTTRMAAETIVIPTVEELIAPIACAVPAQLLAYHVAVLKGTDVDQPRNLAKSVTVE